MPVDIKPSTYLSNYSNYNGTVTIPLGLSTSEADPAIGDIRKIVHDFVKEIYQSYIGLPADSRPGKFSIVKSTPTGVDTHTIRQSYTLTFDFDTSNVQVANES